MILYNDFYSKAKAPQDLAKLALMQGSAIKPVVEAFGLVPVASVVAAMIDGYCQQFNVSKNMTARQIEDLALDLVIDFKDRTGNQVMLEELAIFFDRAAQGLYNDPKTGKPVKPFDRIDRGLIEQLLDVYFETDRTRAVWDIEDEREARKRETVQETPRLSNGQSDPVESTVKDIYTRYAGQGPKLVLAKMLNEMGEKYGENEQSPNA